MTLNEQGNLREAVESFPRGVDVTVYDSFSTDATVSLAESLKVRVIQRKFDNWSSHQNWAVANIRFANPWVYYADADERMTPELWQEMCQRLREPYGHVAFEMRRKDFFGGRWIRHSSFYPCWFVRLFRPERIRWERLVNPVAVVDGPVGRLNEHILHMTFSKGVGQWFERHVAYAGFEAQEMLGQPLAPRDFKLILSKDPTERRRAVKKVFQHMPARPAAKFMTLYLVKGGFLDGRPGFRYALMQAMYEYIITLRLAELKEPQLRLAHERNIGTDTTATKLTASERLRP